MGVPISAALLGVSGDVQAITVAELQRGKRRRNISKTSLHNSGRSYGLN